MSCITEPWTCLNDAAGAVAGAAASSALDRFVESVTDAMQRTTNLWLTWWMSPALSPTVASGDAPVGSVRVLQDSLQTLTVVAAVVGVLLGCIQVALTHSAKAFTEVGMMFLSVITVSALGAVTVQIGVDFSDAFAPWVLQQGTSGSSPDLFPKAASAALGPFLAIMMGGLVVLGNLAQVAFMLFRAGVLPLLVAVLPLAAAMSSSDAGRQWFKKILGWLLAFVLYKPMAALVYAGGFALISSATLKGGVMNSAAMTDQLKPIFQILSGFVLVLLAVLCLPAMIKLISPLAAAGSSNLFSGAAAAGMVVAGAVSVASLGAGAPALAGAAGAGPAGAGAGGGLAGGGAGGGGAGGGGARGGAREIGSTPTSQAAISGGSDGVGPAGDSGGRGSGSGGTSPAPRALPNGGGDGSAPSAAGSTPSSTSGATTVSSGSGAGGGGAPPAAPTGGGAASGGGTSVSSGAEQPAVPAPPGYTSSAGATTGRSLGAAATVQNVTSSASRAINDAVDGGAEPPAGAR